MKPFIRSLNLKAIYFTFGCVTFSISPCTNSISSLMCAGEKHQNNSTGDIVKKSSHGKPPLPTNKTLCGLNCD